MKIATAQVILSILIIVGFFGSLCMLLLKPDTLNDINKEPIMLMVGALIAAFSLLVGFYFGSSAGSARKTDMLAKADKIIDLTEPVQ